MEAGIGTAGGVSGPTALGRGCAKWPLCIRPQSSHHDDVHRYAAFEAGSNFSSFFDKPKVTIELDSPDIVGMNAEFDAEEILGVSGIDRVN